MAGVRRAQLHVHLEGSLGPETLREIEPSLTLEEIRNAHQYSDFMGFIQTFIWVNRKLRSPADYAIAARRLFERMLADGVDYAEVTLSAGVVLWKKQDLGAVFDAVANEGAKAPLRVRWILDATRQWGVNEARPVFDFAAERRDDGVVAVGLGGIEAEGPALWYKDSFQEARDRGLHTVCHAGETTDAQSVWDALEIGAERIGHGIRSIEDPALLAALKERNVPLEVCITSNVRTGAVTSTDDHPAGKLYAAGVPMVLDTDDPAIFGCTLEGEYRLAAERFGVSLDQAAANSLTYAFERPA